MAVVGGGYTGLWTALALKERQPSIDVVVLEAEFCGFGPSGRNGGFLETYWAALPRLRDRLGDDEALAVARASEGALDAVQALDDDVWLRVSGLLEVSASTAQDAAVDRAVHAARELGVEEEAVPLSASELESRIRSPRFRSGVLFPKVGTVQPARLVRALRRRATRSGCPHPRANAGDAHSLRCRGDCAGTDTCLGGGRGDERVGRGLEAARAVSDTVRQLRGAHGAGTRAVGGDRLDGR